MSKITRVHMPRRHDGTLPPNPVRFMCDQGHIHPSFRHAVKCNRRTREKQS